MAEQTGYLSVSVTTFDTSSPLRGAEVMIPLTASCAVGSERRTPSCVYTADAPAVSGKGVYRG